MGLDNDLENFITDTKNPFVEAIQQRPVPTAPATGLKKLTRLAVKGASLGLVNRDTEAEGLLEHGVEFAGSIPTIAGVSAVASPLVGLGARAAGVTLGPAAARLAAATVTGAGVGAVEGAASGEGVLEGAAKGAAGFAAGEGLFLGAGKVLSKLRAAKPELKPSVAIATEQEQKELAATIRATTTKVPETPGKLVLTPEEAFAKDEGRLIIPAASYGPKIDSQSRAFGPPGKTGRNQIDDFINNPFGIGKDEYGSPLPYDYPGVFTKDTIEDFIKFKQDPTKHMTLVKDPETGLLLYKSNSQVADDIADSLIKAPSQRQIEMQFGKDQINYFLVNQTGKDTMAKIAAIAEKREERLTSKLIQLSEDEVEKIVQNEPPVKLTEPSIVNKSKDALKVEELGAKNGHNAIELVQIERDVAEALRGKKFANPTEARLTSKSLMLKMLKERCK